MSLPILWHRRATHAWANPGTCVAAWQELRTEIRLLGHRSSKYHAPLCSGLLYTEVGLSRSFSHDVCDEIADSSTKIVAAHGRAQNARDG